MVDIVISTLIDYYDIYDNYDNHDIYDTYDNHDIYDNHNNPDIDDDLQEPHYSLQGQLRLPVRDPLRCWAPLFLSCMNMMMISITAID